MVVCRVSVLFDDFNVPMSMYDIVLLIFTVYVLFFVQLSFLVLIVIENLYNSKK